MAQKQKTCAVSPESSAVQAHVALLQDVIRRMASNSAACKTWCVTLVSAVLVLAVDKGDARVAWIALLPLFPLWVLDLYYLAFEKAFRESYNVFVTAVQKGEADASCLYQVRPTGDMVIHRMEALVSFSTWGFYLPIALIVAVAKFVVFDA